MYLLCSGDIEANPGPTINPCSVCTKPVAINHRALHYNKCEKDCHIGKKCGNISLKDYKEMKSNGFVSTWICLQCKAGSDQNNQGAATLNILTEDLDDINVPRLYDSLIVELETERKDQLKIAHVIVNGLSTRKKLSEIILLLESTSLDILGITESKLDKHCDNEALQIDGYKFVREDRPQGGGGGCIVYCKESLEATLYEMKNDSKTVESVCLDFTFHSQKLLVAVIYRQPKDSQFYVNIEQYLEDALPKRKKCPVAWGFQF